MHVDSAFDAHASVIRKTDRDWEVRLNELQEVVWSPPGYAVVGVGRERVAIGLCDQHVLKVDPWWWTSTENEVAIWRSADADVRPLLCPILAHGRWRFSLWALQPRCTPLAFGTVDERLPHARIDGVADLWEGNFGALGDRIVVVDYGNLTMTPEYQLRTPTSVRLMLADEATRRGRRFTPGEGFWDEIR